MKFPNFPNFPSQLPKGGVISDSKNFVAVFAVILRGGNDEFSGKGGVWLQSEKFVAKKRNIVLRNEGGGVVRRCLEVFQKFIQNCTGRRP